MKRNFLLGFLASSALMLTSCMSDGESYGDVECFCTITKSSNQVVFHIDGGGTIYPTSESLYSFSNLNGFNDIKRAHIVASYPMSGYSQDETTGEITVREANLFGIQKIYINEYRSKKEADFLKLTEPDSLADFISLEKVYGYNGYLTAIYKSKYYVRNSVSILPTVNMILEPVEDDIKTYNGELLLNLHPLKDESKEVLQNQGSFLKSSIDISALSYILPPSGIDSITINLNGNNLKEKKVKIAVKDLPHKY